MKPPEKEFLSQKEVSSKEERQKQFSYGKTTYFS
jgi:hypothetical protein